MKTATVTEVKGCREWKGERGTIWFHDIVLDNGDKGSIGKKNQNAVREGDSLNYTIDGDRIKEVQQFGNGGGGGFRGGTPASKSAMALAYAKDLIVAQIAAGKTGEAKTSDLAEATITVAKKFHAFIKEND